MGGWQSGLQGGGGGAGESGDHRLFPLKALRARAFDGNSTGLGGTPMAHQGPLSMGLRWKLDGAVLDGARWSVPSSIPILQSSMSGRGLPITPSAHETSV